MASADGVGDGVFGATGITIVVLPAGVVFFDVNGAAVSVVVAVAVEAEVGVTAAASLFVFG